MPIIRIAYIIDAMESGGTEKQLKLLIDGLNTAQYEAHLFLLRPKVSADVLPKNCILHTLDVPSLISWNGLKQLLTFSRLLRKQKFHIVQTFFQDSMFFGIAAAIVAGTCRSIVSINDMLFWASPLQFHAYKFVCRFADKVVVNSSAAGELVSTHIGPEKITVIQNALDVNRFSKRSNEAKTRLCMSLHWNPEVPVVVITSNMNRTVKRVDVLVESMPHVLREAGCHFLFVGDGYLRPQLEKRVYDLGLSNEARFLGHRKDVPEILAGCDLAVNTSDSESMSNSLLEAMLAGLPVIASDVPGNAQLVGKQYKSMMFSRGSSLHLSQKLRDMIRNLKRWQQFSMARRSELMQDYSPERKIGVYGKVYKSMVGSV